MAETKLVVDNREQLWTLLVEAAQIEHMVMCQYLYACSSLKTDPDEGLTAEQADAVARWQETLTGIAIEEMLHLALITAMRGNRQACRSSRRGQLRGGGRCGDRAAARRVRAG
jgi:Ferritin-like